MSDFSSVMEGWLASLRAELSSVSRLAAFVADKNREDVVAKSDVMINAMIDLMQENGKSNSNIVTLKRLLSNVGYPCVMLYFCCIICGFQI